MAKKSASSTTSPSIRARRASSVYTGRGLSRISSGSTELRPAAAERRTDSAATVEKAAAAIGFPGVDERAGPAVAIPPNPPGGPAAAGACVAATGFCESKPAGPPAGVEGSWCDLEAGTVSNPPPRACKERTGAAPSATVLNKPVGEGGVGTGTVEEAIVVAEKVGGGAAGAAIGAAGRLTVAGECTVATSGGAGRTGIGDGTFGGRSEEDGITGCAGVDRTRDRCGVVTGTSAGANSVVAVKREIEEIGELGKRETSSRIPR